jgi:hypothetical protein
MDLAQVADFNSTIKLQERMVAILVQLIQLPSNPNAGGPIMQK